MNLLSPWHILVVLVVVLLVFGPEKIPEVARQLGNGMRQFRDIQAMLRGEISGLLDIGDDDTEPPAYASPPEGRPLPPPRPYRAPATNGTRSGASMPSRYRAPDGRRLSQLTPIPAPAPLPRPLPRPLPAAPVAPVARRQAPSRFRSPRPPGPSTNGSS
ncbi:MAG: twin-arginine translocase TatA/TatE family subunit [Actinobacteria bacterium]|nr:twin-arginine translocase TatA/TatE family subunit [Actinomycetota bacterium]